MLNATADLGWLGYALDRTRGKIGTRELGDRVLLLGRKAGDLSTLFAYSLGEAGARPLIFDVDGSISPDIRGHFEAYDYRSMLYEAFHLEGEGAVHGQLVTAAYAAALDLTSEEEAILIAALRNLSEQNDLATPSSLYDVLGGVEGFRGFYVDKLKGRIGSLKLLETTRVDAFDELTRGGALVDFSSAPYPQAAELAATLYIAKLLYLLGSTGKRPSPLMITGAHQLFKNLNHFQHGARLMASLLEAPVPLVLSTGIPALLNDRLVDSMAVRIYSSEAWNGRRSMKQATALACSYVICDDRSGVSVGFVPRFIRPKRTATIFSPPPPGSNPELTKTILEEVSRFETANRQSMISYLSPLFLAEDIGTELDRLHSRGFLILEPKQEGSGPKNFAYTVTEAGRRLLEGLK